MNSDNEWKKRRMTFRHAFNPVGLRSFDGILDQLLKGLSSTLDEVVIKNQSVLIDSVFSRFALDTVFRVGFELNYDFLHDRDGFEVPKRIIL